MTLVELVLYLMGSGLAVLACGLLIGLWLGMRPHRPRRR